MVNLSAITPNVNTAIDGYTNCDIMPLVAVLVAISTLSSNTLFVQLGDET